jgi:hypothetical protein
MNEAILWEWISLKADHAERMRMEELGSSVGAMSTYWEGRRDALRDLLKARGE